MYTNKYMYTQFDVRESVTQTQTQHNTTQTVCFQNDAVEMEHIVCIW